MQFGGRKGSQTNVSLSQDAVGAVGSTLSRESRYDKVRQSWRRWPAASHLAFGSSDLADRVRQLTPSGEVPYARAHARGRGRQPALSSTTFDPAPAAFPAPVTTA
jgi:hypothetical protein